MSRPRTLLRLEALEDRTAPAVFGPSWPEPGRITVSFAPDGTDVSGRASDLFAALAGQGLAPAAWQGEILRALQTWAVQTNINFALAADNGWSVKADGDHWRRVVPSPKPKRIFEIRPMRWLLEQGAVVICAGGGGIPTMYERGAERRLTGVEAVIDKDLASSLLAQDLDADLYVMATDVDGVYVDWAKPTQARIDRITPEQLAAMSFPAGSAKTPIGSSFRPGSYATRATTSSAAMSTAKLNAR